MQSPGGNQLWCPGQSLWSLIAEHVSGSELPKIHTALGYSLVDMYTEVHTEAEMWHKMWQESQQGNHSSRTGVPHPSQQVPLLADPPVVKELVRAEVKMLLQNLREGASREGRDSEELLFRYKPETVDYAMSHLDSSYRNSPNPGDTDNGSRPSSHCSVQSSAEDEIEAVRDKLNVTDIDQVVDRLRCVLMEECEALNTLVKHFKMGGSYNDLGNIKQKCLSHEINKSEPTLAELKELRGAIQMDLELYSSSSASSPLPLKELKHRFRLSAGQRVSHETLQALSPTSALRPHPPPLSHPVPRPPPGPPPSKTSASLKPIHGPPLSRTSGQHRSASAPTGPRKTQIPTYHRITTSPSGPDSDKMMVKTSHHCSLPSDQHSDGLNIPRNSPIHETHHSSHRSIHSQNIASEVSQTGRRSSPDWRSRNANTIPSTGATDHSTSTTGKSKKCSPCGGGLVSAALQTDHDTTKSFQIKSGSFSAQSDSRKSNIGNNESKNGHQEKTVIQLQKPVAAATHSTQTKATFLTLGDTTSSQKGVRESQMELEFFTKFHQPVPPARVSS